MSTSFTLNRRDFAKVTAAFASTAAMSAASAVADEAPSASDGATEPSIPLEDARYTADVVVVGSGAAGMTAALEAANQGGRVVLLEAGSFFGGATNMAGGILGINTPFLQEQGIKNDPAELLKYELTFSNYIADPRFIRDMLNEADDNIAWLQSMGLEFFAVLGTTQHLYTGEGAALIGILKGEAEGKVEHMLLETRGKQLYLRDGAVAGILCEDAGGEFAIEAPAVILAAGGFMSNPQMIRELVGRDSSRFILTTVPTDIGDGIAMAYQAGGARGGAASIMLQGAGLPGIPVHGQFCTAAFHEPYLFVNEDAERFMDEGVSADVSLYGNPVLNQKRGISILSQAELDRVAQEGATLGWANVFKGTPLDEVQAELDDALRLGYEGIHKADSIVELAESCGLDPEALVATVERYNGFCDAGLDEDFFKDPAYLRRIPDEGPFYAFEMMVSAYATIGGVRIDRKNRVVDEQFEPIPGLWCAGVDCSGLQGHTYCMGLAGGAQAYCVYSGRNSAREAVAYATGA